MEFGQMKITNILKDDTIIQELNANNMNEVIQDISILH